MPYYYENHMGGWYTSEYELDYDDLYCEECGDSDWELGWYEDDEDFARNSGYYSDYSDYEEELAEQKKQEEKYKKLTTYPDVPEKIVDINKYKLTLKNIKQLKVNRDLVNKENGFWRNEAIQGWCISGSVGVDEYPICDATEYWLGVFDKPKKDGSVKVDCHFTCWSGMGGYTFDKFFDKKDIENRDQYAIQYRFISRMNELIEKGVFYF